MLVDQVETNDDLLTRGAGDEPDTPMIDAQHTASWNDYEPRHVILGDEMYLPGLRHVHLGARRS